MNVIVVGCGNEKGMGNYFRQQLLNDGHKVFGVGNSGPDFKTDFLNAINYEAIIAKAKGYFGSKPDALLNNVGTLKFEFIKNFNGIHYAEEMALNFFTPVALTQEFAKVNPEGRIVNISSMAAFQSFRGHAAYCASKAALEAWCGVFARETKTFIACVAPASVEGTPMIETSIEANKSAYGLNDEDAAKRTHLPVGRSILKSEVWDTVKFALFDAPQSMSGSVLRFPAGSGV